MMSELFRWLGILGEEMRCVVVFFKSFFGIAGKVIFGGNCKKEMVYVINSVVCLEGGGCERVERMICREISDAHEYD